MIRSLDEKRPRIASSAFVSEAAYVIGDVEIGEHSSVWPGAVIRGDFARITIGSRTLVEDNCVVHTGEDLSIGEHVIVGHGAVVHCRKVGNRVLIGNNAVLLDGAEVGDFCIIAAGSVVPADARIPEYSLVTGVPGRVKRRLSPEQVTRLQEGARSYFRLAERYKQQGL